MDYLEIEIYVRFCETDELGHVNNTSYFRYFEEARAKFFDVIYPDRSPSFSFIIASISCDYIQQAFAGEILIVNTIVNKIGNKSFTITQMLKNKETGITIAKGVLVLVCYNKEKGISITIPEPLGKNIEMMLSYI